MRRGERAGHHRLGGELADALDRDALLARPGRTPARAGAAGSDRRRGRPRPRPRASTSSRVIEPRGPVPVTAGQVDAEVLASLRTGGLASTLTGRRRRRGPTGSAAGPPSAAGAGAAVAATGGRVGDRPARRPRAGARRAPARAPCAAALAAGRRPVADQHRRPPARRRPPIRPGSTAPSAGATVDRRPAPPAAPAGRPVRVGVDRDDRRPDLDRRALARGRSVTTAGARRRQLDRRLRRLHLDDRLVQPDRVADA